MFVFGFKFHESFHLIVSFLHYLDGCLLHFLFLISGCDRYSTINKQAGIVHWLKHSKDAENVDWLVILDATTIVRIPIVRKELGDEKGKSVAGYYG